MGPPLNARAYRALGQIRHLALLQYSLNKATYHFGPEQLALDSGAQAARPSSDDEHLILGTNTALPVHLVVGSRVELLK